MNILIIMLNKKNKSKRRRSLKRRNVKSRKVMRGGGFDKTDINVVKKGKAKLYKMFPMEFGPDGHSKLSTHDIQYKISEILNEGTVARIQVIKIDDDNIEGYFTHINYPKGTIETYQPNTDMVNSFILKMTNGDKYWFHEIL
jgi:hypothetical protein